MNEDSMLYCLIAFILGWLVSRHIGDGFSVGAQKFIRYVPYKCVSKTNEEFYKKWHDSDKEKMENAPGNWPKEIRENLASCASFNPSDKETPMTMANIKNCKSLHHSSKFWDHDHKDVKKYPFCRLEGGMNWWKPGEPYPKYSPLPERDNNAIATIPKYQKAANLEVWTSWLKENNYKNTHNTGCDVVPGTYSGLVNKNHTCNYDVNSNPIKFIDGDSKDHICVGGLGNDTGGICWHKTK